MNSNLFLFISFLLIFLLSSLFQIEIKWEYFLSSIINNEVWRFIILWVVLFIFGKKYVDELEGIKRTKY